MIGHKAVVGLSLLCALLFSAFAAEGASAAVGKNITAFTCKEEATAAFDFEDPHCDSKSATKTGKFNHVGIPVKTSTQFTFSNETTNGNKAPLVIKGKPFGVSANISCNTITGSGVMENSEPTPFVHKVTGNGTMLCTEATVSEPKKCTVKEPAEIKIGSTESQEGLTGPKGEANAMGLELKPETGKPIAEVTLEGAECALKGKPFPIEGSVIETNGPGIAEPQANKWHGATVVYTAEESMSKLTAGGKAATMAGVFTYRMEGGNPITFTTVT